MSRPQDSSWRCAESDQVIAHYLDGVIDGDREGGMAEDDWTPEGPSALDLATHLRGCGSCQHELALARRLDALVAATTAAVDAQDLQHAFATLRAPKTETLAEAGAVTALTSRRLWRRALLVATLLVVVAAALLWSLRATRGAPAVADEKPAPAPNLDPATISIPDEDTSLRVRPRTRPPTDLSPLTRFRRHGDDESFKALVQVLGAPALAEGDAALLVAASHAPAFVSRLERELTQRDPSLGLLQCAARVPTSRLDAALRELGRGDAARSELLALAVSERSDVEHSVPLLLDLWTECAARRGDLDPEARARRWFLRAPAAAGRQLEHELARTPSAERRQRCLLALGALAAPEPVPTLLALAKGPRREEALLATYALYLCGGLPQAAADLRPAWFAALCAKPRTFVEFSRHVDSPRRGEPVSESD